MTRAFFGEALLFFLPFAAFAALPPDPPPQSARVGVLERPDRLGSSSPGSAS